MQLALLAHRVVDCIDFGDVTLRRRVFFPGGIIGFRNRLHDMVRLMPACVQCIGCQSFGVDVHLVAKLHPVD